MEHSVIEVIRLIADVVIVPMFAVLWGIQGRISKIEGMLATRERRDSEHGN